MATGIVILGELNYCMDRRSGREMTIDNRHRRLEYRNGIGNL